VNKVKYKVKGKNGKKDYYITPKKISRKKHINRMAKQLDKYKLMEVKDE